MEADKVGDSKGRWNCLAEEEFLRPRLPSSESESGSEGGGGMDAATRPGVAEGGREVVTAWHDGCGLGAAGIRCKPF